MEQMQLFPLSRQKVQVFLNGYVQSPAITDHIDDYIVPNVNMAREDKIQAKVVVASLNRFRR